MKHTLIIQGSLPNLNDYTRACRSNKFAGANVSLSLFLPLSHSKHGVCFSGICDYFAKKFGH